MDIRVLKFGGTSVATTEKIQNIAAFLKKQGEPLVIVISAMNKLTDELLTLASQVNDAPSKRELDMLLTTGEQQSAALMALALQAIDVPAVSLTGLQAGLKTTGLHTKSMIQDISTERMKQHLDMGEIVIITGFQGVNETGDFTTLGRGGSDTSAVAIAAALQASCEIYTDVPGIFSVDPRQYKDAKKLTFITYDEMMELALQGASVMETRAVELAKKYQVPLYVAQTLATEKGTWIVEGDKKMEQKIVTGLGIDENILRINIRNLEMNIENIATLFETLNQKEINIDMISQNADQSLAFTCTVADEVDVLETLTELQKRYPEMLFTLGKNFIKLSLVGIGMMSSPGTAAKLFSLLAQAQIDVKQVSTSDISISIIIQKEMKEKAISSIATTFNL